MLALVCGNTISSQYETRFVSFIQHTQTKERGMSTFEQLKARELVVTGHFVYPSRLHGNDFVSHRGKIFPNHSLSPTALNVDEFRDDNVETVVGRELYAAIRAQCVADHLSELRNMKVFRFCKAECRKPLHLAKWWW